MKLNSMLKFNFEDTKSAILNQSIPVWLKEFQIKSLGYLFESEFPNSNMESWRKISLKNLDPNLFLAKKKYNLKFINFEQEKIAPILNEILETNKKSFFVCLQLSFLDELNYYKLKDNDNININHTNSNLYDSNFTLNIYHNSKNSSTQIIENNEKSSTEDYRLNIPFTYIKLEENSNLKFIEISKFSSRDFHFGNIYSVQDKNSNLNIYPIYISGYKGKSFIQSNLNGSNSELNILGCGSLNGNEIHDIECTVNHNESNTMSQINYRTIISDKSHNIFTGNLFIPKTSKKVVASQVNHNLSLNHKARAESMPKLEVFAEDVKCSHGATVSEVNKEQMFYLLSRGINEIDSKKLIIEGFVKEILDSITDETLRDNLLLHMIQKQKNINYEKN